MFIINTELLEIREYTYTMIYNIINKRFVNI